MKHITMRHITIRYIALAVAAFVAVGLAGCSSSRELTAQEIQNHQQAAARLVDKQFVITANRLMIERRNFPAVSPSSNFIRVDGDDALVQINPGMGGGPNGIGGFTVKGVVSGFEANTKANGAVSLRFNVKAPVGGCTVFVNLPKNGTTASVTIQNTLRGGNANFSGEVLASDTPLVIGRAIN